MLEPVLLELALLFALCVAVAVVFVRLRLPPIVGFLVTGALVGPYSIRLVEHEDMVRQLAEVGIVVLLFTVGLEIPLGQFGRLRRAIAIGGGLQIAITTTAAALACWLGGLTWNQAVFLGFLLSLSSTAAVTKVLVDHGEFASPHGRLAMAINVAQDLAVVPMVLLIPLLAGTPSGAAAAAGTTGSGWRTLTNLLQLGVVLVLARVLIPRILDLVCRTRSRELFVLTLATFCLTLAVVTAHLGLSLALGALLAGMLLADSDYHGQAMAEVEPFRDALASLFFVSIGMLFDWRTIVDSPGLVTIALLAVLAGKTGVVLLAARVLGQPFWVRLRAALVLAQVGEFSFVLVQVGAGTDVLPERAERIFLVVAVLSIASTPLLYALGQALLARRRHHHDTGRERDPSRLEGHAIVVGYGPTGRTVVAALQSLGLPVIVAEMNANTVKIEKAAGVPIVLGDATRVPVLRQLGIERANLLVLAVNDTAAAARTAQLARQLAPQVHVLARSVYIGEVAGLRQAGVHEVVPQELEASIEILVRVLRQFLVADDEIGRRVREVRDQVDAGGKAAPLGPRDLSKIIEFVPGIGLAVHRVDAAAAACGRSLAEVGVRRNTGCSVVAVRRHGVNLPIVTPETALQADDIAVLIGPEVRLPDAAAMFQAPVAPSPVVSQDPLAQ
ncbi:MAG: cation:proton antiporter [Planctomycetes bacterium]|nr:cation:proton antiporter [Planctomycetota bacterium]